MPEVLFECVFVQEARTSGCCLTRSCTAKEHWTAREAHSRSWSAKRAESSRAEVVHAKRMASPANLRQSPPHRSTSKRISEYT